MSNRTNLSASYNYTVTAAPDNSAYLWSGHGLENAPNPTIYIRSDDNITITNASGGHVMELSADFVAWSVTESNGQIVLVSDPALFGEGEYTYVCTSHPAMTGKLIVSHVVADGGPEDGYGTGPLPETQNAIKMDAIRTKINEIVTKGGIGGASVGTVLPTSASDGDLFYDETTGALYIYLEDISAWVQTNGGAGGGSIEVSDTAPSSPSDGDLWFNTTEGQLYVYVASETAWFQTNGGSSSGGGAGSVNFSTGWVNTGVANGATLNFDHNLGTEDLIVQVYMAKDANGTDKKLTTFDSQIGDGEAGLQVTNVTSSSIEVQLARYGWLYLSSGGDRESGNWGFIYTHIQVVASSGAGGTSGGASIEVSDTAPASPSDGNLWFNTTEAELYVYVDAEGAWVQTNGGGGAGSGNFSTGWVNTDGTTAVADGATLNFDHNLGTTDVIFDVYVADDSNGTNAFRVGDAQDAGFNTAYGASIQSITNSNFVLQLASGGTHGGAMTMDSSGDKSFIDYANKYIKVVASSGAGSGPRAYVTFDGTAADMATELSGANSLNVSSITDHGAGDYTINYTNPVSQPIISIGYQVRASSPFHALYWGIIDQTDSYARIGLGSNNVYYDHPYVSFIAH